MEKHTKGPWRTDGNGIITGGPDYCTSIGTTPVILWRTGSSGASTKNQKGQIETAQANARLIAAAPELLEACKHLCKTLKPYVMSLGVKKGFSEMVALAEAEKAIWKT